MTGDLDEEHLTTMEDVRESIEAFNCNKESWIAMSKDPSPIEERMMPLDEFVKKKLADPA